MAAEGEEEGEGERGRARAKEWMPFSGIQETRLVYVPKLVPLQTNPPTAAKTSIRKKPNRLANEDSLTGDVT